MKLLYEYILSIQEDLGDELALQNDADKDIEADKWDQML